MIARLHRGLLERRLGQFPAVALLGPRQCGKTTLARQLGGRYFDLEQASEVTRLDAHWDEMMNERALIILDEAQWAPPVFSRLRGAIDAERERNGRFLLLGSVSPALMQSISESLAGRLAVVELSPFILPEIDRVDDLWLFGGYPQGGILERDLFGVWQESYLSLLIGRDLPNWGLPAKPQTTQRFVRMLAASHGQTVNAARLGASLGLDDKTVTRYGDFLEGAFLIRRLAPYHANIKKRLVRSPKLLWRDTGLLHYLLGARDTEQLFSQPWVGQSWEGFVIEQTIATLAALGRQVHPFFFRTSDGYELDLVLDWGVERWAIEIKLTSNPSVQMTQRLNKTADMIGASRRVLVCRLAREIETDRLWITNPRRWIERLRRTP